MNAETQGHKADRQASAAIRACSIFLVLASVGASQAGWFGPSNVRECVLDRMQGVKSDVAASAIIAACAAEFREKPKPRNIPIPAHVMATLDVRGSLRSSYASGKIYNGNDEWHITEISLTVRFRADEGANVHTPLSRQYQVDVDIAPQGSGDFHIWELHVPPELHPIGWSVAAARGYPADQ